MERLGYAQIIHHLAQLLPEIFFLSTGFILLDGLRISCIQGGLQ
jgi:hypothetical protein